MRNSRSPSVKQRQTKVSRIQISPTPSPPNTVLLPSPEWFASNGPIDVSIITPLYTCRKLLQKQIAQWDIADDGILKEIIYVDDGCPEKSYMEVIKNWQERRRDIQRKKIGKIIITSRRMGFGHACNLGAKLSEAKYLVFLPPNFLPQANWIRPMIESIDFDSSIGAIGPMALEDDLIQSCGAELNGQIYEQIGNSIYKGKKIKPMKVAELPADLLRPGEREMLNSSFAIEKSFFDELNGFNVSNLDWKTCIIEFMKRIKLSKKLWFQPNSRISDISHKYWYDVNK